jgi:hypothetical protein
MRDHPSRVKLLPWVRLRSHLGRRPPAGRFKFVARLPHRHGIRLRDKPGRQHGELCVLDHTFEIPGFIKLVCRLVVPLPLPLVATVEVAAVGKVVGLQRATPKTRDTLCNLIERGFAHTDERGIVLVEGTSKPAVVECYDKGTQLGGSPPATCFS